MISVLVGVGTPMGEDGEEAGRVGIDGITALLRLTDGLGELVKIGKKDHRS